MKGANTKFDIDLERRKRSIISKGMDATKSDIWFLIEVAKISKTEVAGLIGMNKDQFFEVCRNWGIGKIHDRRTGA